MRSTKSPLFAGFWAMAFTVLIVAGAPADHIYRASALHLYVKNAQGETLGDVEDFVVNTKTGEILYAAMAHGETLGFGGKLFAISPRALTLSKDGKHFMLNFSPKDFQEAKGFDANRWPNEPDLHWGGKVPWLRTDDKKMDAVVRLSRITGLPVRNTSGEDLGKVYDFAINTKEHRVEYAGIAYGTTLGVGGKMLAVPCKSLMLQSQKLDPSRREFVLDVRKADFNQAEGFKNDRWPEFPDPRFDKK